MARSSKIAVLSKIGSAGMVPVLYHKDVEVTEKVVKACYDGGVRAFGFISHGNFTREIFAEIVKYTARECPEMAIGAGSVVDPATATMYLQLRTNFVVSLLFNSEITRICSRRLAVYTPDCGSVSEVGFAQEVGYDLCKMLPGNVCETNLMEGLMAPMSWSKLMVTGRVEPFKENLTAWIKAGVFYVGIGSKLFPDGKVAAKDWAYVAAKCEETLGYIAEARRK